MQDEFTAGVLRAMARAEGRSLRLGKPQIEPIDLLAALADDDESRAASLLAQHGLSPDAVLAALGVGPSEGKAPEAGERPLLPTPQTRALMRQAAATVKARDRTLSAGTEHILEALLRGETDLGRTLERAGLDLPALLAEMAEDDRKAAEPIPVPPDIDPLELFSPADAMEIGRVIDASSNRAREGLRVVEDYVRFVLDDPLLTRRLKGVRHRLDEAVRAFDADLLLDARDTPGDVGTHIMTRSEQTRENPRAVLAANFKRCGEALRSLEEYAKLLNEWVSGRFEGLRYDLYTLEKLVLSAISAHRSLDQVRLYLLVGGLPTLGDLTWIVGEALQGGVQAIQLREKGLPDREILTRAREVRILTAQARARFFLNDRADLAKLSGADGVHLGQDDLSPRDARRVVGPRALLGVSTHEPAQVEKAAIEGAGYLGVGPVFPSETKGFASHAGLGFVRQAAEMTTLPWFAIGGISAANLDEVIESGASRVAVSAAIVKAESPRAAAKEFRRRLDAAS